MKTIPIMETRTATLLTALAIGCGLAFHPIFFLIAAAILLLVTAEWVAGEFAAEVRVSRKKRQLFRKRRGAAAHRRGEFLP